MILRAVFSSHFFKIGSEKHEKKQKKGHQTKWSRPRDRPALFCAYFVSPSERTTGPAEPSPQHTNREASLLNILDRDCEINGAGVVAGLCVCNVARADTENNRAAFLTCRTIQESGESFPS